MADYLEEAFIFAGGAEGAYYVEFLGGVVVEVRGDVDDEDGDGGFLLGSYGAHLG